MAEITLSGIRKSYGAVEVIHGLDLDIDDGEFVTLVGPSGCGKSTLLRMIAGLEESPPATLLIDGGGERARPAGARSRWCSSPTRSTRT